MMDAEEASAPPPRPKKLGKRRQRRHEQEVFLEQLLEDLGESDGDEVPAAKHLLDDEVLLGRFLSGARLRLPQPRRSSSRNLSPRAREAKRGWLRVARCERTWLRRYARTHLNAIEAVEDLLTSWLVADDFLDDAPLTARASVLRVPADVLDPRLVLLLAQFHGCLAKRAYPDTVIVRRPDDDATLLRHGSRIGDVVGTSLR